MHRIPQHISIIMDGNGRWAAENGLSRAEGHRRGAERIEEIIELCKDRGVKFITLYAFSDENWNRPSDEVLALMQLLRHFLVSKRGGMVEKGVRFRVIGDVERLPAELQKDIKETQELTKGGDRITMIVALSYGSRQEILRAVNGLIQKGVGEVTQEIFDEALDTADFPDPDLLIRTSGEFRISNFMLWQLAYTELYFTHTLWPDFDEAELEKAIVSYSQRERRFGMTSEQVK
ncbi:MAG: di-trans,poly-cis-decaprenylcistransferase [Deltaproteobacteria bacterium]|jgi:undecaprenyl diphosphate synthase|nr:di-trans,poly-cis-decaprenylcistransferase [Deltaproteobacteria bacterium]